MNLSHAFLGEIFVIFHRKYLPFFRYFQKNICKLFMSKTRIVENISAAILFIFKKGDQK